MTNAESSGGLSALIARLEALDAERAALAAEIDEEDWAPAHAKSPVQSQFGGGDNPREPGARPGGTAFARQYGAEDSKAEKVFLISEILFRPGFMERFPAV